MRAGLFLGYWPWFSLEEQVSLAVLADQAGLDSVWISEAWGQDAVSMLGLLAGRTERIALGSGLMQIPARQPAAAAMAAASLDVLSGGRFRLGLGVSGPQVSEGWYGVPFRRPLRRTREYVEIVRLALRRRTVRYDGEEWTLPLPGGSGRALKLLASPVQERIPVYLGAIGPRAIEQTGEIADGWLPFMFDPSAPDTLLDPLRRGLARAGRAREDIDVAPCVPFAVAADLGAARDAVRPWLAFYLGAMGAREKNFYVDL
ncbi:MAG TPA: LLM class flavin-dependent oxidoreductase, partial [Solirubrobacteraceae bacterium]|nr:LLM class flavin-dependent oxidoreductase [Solirubrobacteraceae bacterium]